MFSGNDIVKTRKFLNSLLNHSLNSSSHLSEKNLPQAFLSCKTGLFCALFSQRPWATFVAPMFLFVDEHFGHSLNFGRSFFRKYLRCCFFSPDRKRIWLPERQKTSHSFTREFFKLKPPTFSLNTPPTYCVLDFDALSLVIIGPMDLLHVNVVPNGVIDHTQKALCPKTTAMAKEKRCFFKGQVVRFSGLMPVE